MKADFFSSVLDASLSLGSLYEGTLKDRRALALFLDQNGLLDQAGFPMDAREDIIRLRSPWYPEAAARKILLDRLALWLKAYKRSDRHRLAVLLDHGRGLLPQTCHSYKEFFSSINEASPKVAWQLLDYLLSTLDTEVTDMDPARTEKLLASMKAVLPARHLSLFTEYLDFLSCRSTGTRISYSLRSQGGDCRYDAYSFSEFSAMAYFIFNGRYWEEHGLLEKACRSRQKANLWAFLSLFFLCGLRGTDVVRIPRPSLPVEGVEFRRRMLESAIPDPGRFARDIQFRMQCLTLFPSKTGETRDVPALKLSIPTLLEEPAGIILSIAASYYPETSAGQPFLYKNTSYKAIRSFFGQPFADLLGYKGFCIRRANKSYLQGIGNIADTGGTGIPRGYILAALARSHKGSLGTLPETTAVYLKDAAFSGMDPDFVLFEMFQRGVFGFIPHLLMETCFGDRYHHLDIHSQTELICQAGITPSGIESLARAGERALSQAQLVIHDLLACNTDMPSALLRIASGEAAAKQEGYLCVFIASGSSCSFPERRACIGCPYEICTKAALHQLCAEFERLQSLSSGRDGWRARQIAREAVLPVIQEFLTTMRLLYPKEDLSPYHSILQGGIDHYDPFIGTDS